MAAAVEQAACREAAEGGELLRSGATGGTPLRAPRPTLRRASIQPRQPGPAALYCSPLIFFFSESISSTSSSRLLLNSR